MFGALQHLLHPTNCYALCAVARSGAHLLSAGLHATHLAGRPLQYFHAQLAHKYAARYGLDAEIPDLPFAVASDPLHPVDPEAARYAPRPPRRFPWTRRLLALLGLPPLPAGAASRGPGSATTRSASAIIAPSR